MTGSQVFLVVVGDREMGMLMGRVAEEKRLLVTALKLFRQVLFRQMLLVEVLDSLVKVKLLKFCPMEVVLECHFMGKVLLEHTVLKVGCQVLFRNVMLKQKMMVDHLLVKGGVVKVKVVLPSHLTRQVVLDQEMVVDHLLLHPQVHIRMNMLSGSGVAYRYNHHPRGQPGRPMPFHGLSSTKKWPKVAS